MSGRSRSGRRLTALLTVAGLLLATVIAYEITTFTAVHSTGVTASAGAPETPAAPAPARFRLPSIGEYREIITRPLFNETRRPAAADAALSGKVPEINFRLMGVVITDRKREALFQITSRNEVVRGGVEAWIEGWMVEAIEPHRVVLRRSQHTAELLLEPVAPRAPAQRTQPSSERRREP